MCCDVPGHQFDFVTVNHDFFGLQFQPIVALGNMLVHLSNRPTAWAGNCGPDLRAQS